MGRGDDSVVLVVEGDDEDAAAAVAHHATERDACDAADRGAVVEDLVLDPFTDLLAEERVRRERANRGCGSLSQFRRK